ncbi:MAG TPA: sensor histidine kinase [Steroidobacteraceae bacterium]|jgi:two-component system sensor histidine kinase DesK|nr:sensor histidine kinase [Steroidobacteraceae bacterium]
MRLSQLIRNIKDPPPDSMVGYMTRYEGRFMRRMPFFVLINLAWIFLWPVISGQPFLTVILPMLVSVPIFIYLHLCAYFRGGPVQGRWIYILGQYLLAYVVGWFFSLSAIGYTIFAFYVTAFSMSLRQARYVIFGSIAVSMLGMVIQGHTAETMAYIILPAILLAFSALYTAYTGQQQLALRRSEDEVMRLARLAERERIGRDLHDLLGHTLSVVALKSELARKLIDHDVDAARREIAEVERVARDSLQQVRTAVSGIRSTELLAEIGAATALLEAQGIVVKCETENVKLPHDRETALALSLREAATNVRRHAQAKGVTIRVRKEPAEVVVEVADDGRGGRIIPGNGLSGMRERLSHVGGTLTLLPNKDGGTLLRASVPVAA